MASHHRMWRIICRVLIFQAEGVYAGPLDGALNAQTEAALRQYQQKQGIPPSGAPDAATLKELRLNLPASRQGTGN